MASAYVEYGVRAAPILAGGQVPGSDSLNGKAAASEVLTISGTQANGTISGNVASGINVARITTDTLCYVAVGSAPDCTATTATGATGARRVMLANTSMELALAPGQKVSVKSAP